MEERKTAQTPPWGREQEGQPERLGLSRELLGTGAWRRPVSALVARFGEGKGWGRVAWSVHRMAFPTVVSQAVWGPGLGSLLLCQLGWGPGASQQASRAADTTGAGREGLGVSGTQGWGLPAPRRTPEGSCQPHLPAAGNRCSWGFQGGQCRSPWPGHPHSPGLGLVPGPMGWTF